MNGQFPGNTAISAAEASKIKARAEFRVFGHGLIETVQQRMWEAGAVLHKARQMPAETYFVSRLADAANVKVRDGLLDIKLRTGETLEGYEIFQPAGKFRFPLPEADLKAVLAHLGVDMAAGGGSCPHDRFLMLTRTHPGLVVVEVEKMRFGFTVGGVICEYARVLFNGAMMETACCESEDHGALKAAIEALGLAGKPNTSYLRAARRVVGID